MTWFRPSIVKYCGCDDEHLLTVIGQQSNYQYGDFGPTSFSSKVKNLSILLNTSKIWDPNWSLISLHSQSVTHKNGVVTFEFILYFLASSKSCPEHQSTLLFKWIQVDLSKIKRALKCKFPSFCQSRDFFPPSCCSVDGSICLSLASGDVRFLCNCSCLSVAVVIHLFSLHEFFAYWIQMPFTERPREGFKPATSTFGGHSCL